MVNDLKKYKESIEVLNHLDTILHIINLSMKGLSIFAMYAPVQRILFALENEKYILESHYYKYKRIKDNKGRIG